MTDYAIGGPSWVPLDPAMPIVIDEVQMAYGEMLKLTDTERAERGIAPVTIDPIPANKVATGSSLADREGLPVREWVLEDAPPPEPEPVPASISDRQFFQALAIRELISEPEALAAVKTGAIPAQLQVAVDTITDEGQHFAAVMLISGATVFERAHPMAAMLGAAIGKDSTDLDDLWRFGATL